MWVTRSQLPSNYTTVVTVDPRGGGEEGEGAAGPAHSHNITHPYTAAATNCII